MNIMEALAQIESAARGYAARGADGERLIPPEAQRPLYLIGPPGVGKTEIVRQAAARLGIGLVSYTLTHHTRQSALGLPRIVERELGGRTVSCTEYTMSEIIAGVYRQMAETGIERGILFLDEINCVSETLTPALLELLQHKRFGEFAVPEGWMIVCAGNPEAYNRAAHAFDPATLDRLRVIEVEPELSVWLDYAAARGLHPAVRGYLRLQPEDFCAVRGERVVTPRSWADLSRMMAALEAIGERPEKALFAQYLQCAEVAERFALYCALCGGVSARFSLDGVLDGRAPEAAARLCAAPFDEALCAAMLLSSGLNARARAAQRNADTARRLESFVEGALRAGGDLIEACRAQIARLERALDVRRSAGILEAGAEAGERALISAAREAVSVAAGDVDPAARLQSFAESRRAHAQESAPELARAFECALDFAAQAFADPRVRAVFWAELDRDAASAGFLRRALPEQWAAFCREADPERRAEAMRRELRAEGK